MKRNTQNTATAACAEWNIQFLELSINDASKNNVQIKLVDSKSSLYGVISAGINNLVLLFVCVQSWYHASHQHVVHHLEETLVDDIGIGE